MTRKQWCFLDFPTAVFCTPPPPPQGYRTFLAHAFYFPLSVTHTSALKTTQVQPGLNLTQDSWLSAVWMCVHDALEQIFHNTEPPPHGYCVIYIVFLWKCCPEADSRAYNSTQGTFLGVELALYQMIHKSGLVATLKNRTLSARDMVRELRCETKEERIKVMLCFNWFCINKPRLKIGCSYCGLNRLAIQIIQGRIKTTSICIKQRFGKHPLKPLKATFSIVNMKQGFTFKYGSLHSNV